MKKLAKKILIGSIIFTVIYVIVLIGLFIGTCLCKYITG